MAEFVMVERPELTMFVNYYFVKRWILLIISNFGNYLRKNG